MTSTIRQLSINVVVHECLNTRNNPTVLFSPVASLVGWLLCGYFLLIIIAVWMVNRYLLAKLRVSWLVQVWFDWLDELSGKRPVQILSVMNCQNEFSKCACWLFCACYREQTCGSSYSVQLGSVLPCAQSCHHASSVSFVWYWKPAACYQVA
jgi:hypothetical protein